MVLEAVAAGIVVRVAAKVRQDEQRGLAGVLRFALDGLPDVGAETIGPPDTLNIERVGSCMGDVDIVHGNPQQAGRQLAHQLADDIDGEFVGA